MMTPKQESECLAYDPFAGDMDVQAKIFTDRMVTAAKDRPGGCNICFGDIVKGERHRQQKAVVDGEFHSPRFCEKCCIAMAESWKSHDAGELIELRTELGMARLGRFAPARPDLTEAEFFVEKQRERIAVNSKRAADADAQAEADRIGKALGDLASPAPPRALSGFMLTIFLALVAAVAVFFFLAHGR